MYYNTSSVFYKKDSLSRSPEELCYEYQSPTNPKWIRYCIFNKIHKTVTMERCERSYFDGYEDVNIEPKVIEYIVSIAPNELSLSHNPEQGWS